MFSRVSPTPDDLPIQITIPAIDADLPDTVVHASDTNFQPRRSSELVIRKNTRISMDLTSKGTLSFHNINYIVGGRHANSRMKKWYSSFIKPKPGKQVINDVSGTFTSGMNAIMGKN
jgi:hypothetical protein